MERGLNPMYNEPLIYLNSQIYLDFEFKINIGDATKT